jgi:hypothetical protein
MLGTFLDKMSGIFDQRFIVAYWIPIFFGLMLLVGLGMFLLGPSVMFGWWMSLNSAEKVLLGIGALLCVSLLAYLLETLTAPIVRLYEGYWREGTLTRGLRTQKQKKLNDKKEALAAAELDLTIRIKALRAEQEVVADQQSDLTDRLKTLSVERETLAIQQSELASRLRALSVELEDVTDQQSDLTIHTKTLNDEQVTLTARENDLLVRLKVLNDEQVILTARENDLLVRLKATEDKKKALDAKLAYVYAAYYLKYPRDLDHLKPTRLGNVLAAAEEYSSQVYSLDGVIWWPRLAPLLPVTFRAQVDTALTPMLTALNLSMILTLFALPSGMLVLPFSRPWWLLPIISLGELLLGWICYSAAVSQAKDYGKVIRVAFDLYRHEILKQMHLPVPDNLTDERLLWASLNKWLYEYTPPWESVPVGVDAPRIASPFYYDTHYSLTIPPQLQEVTFTFKGLSKLMFKDEAS